MQPSAFEHKKNPVTFCDNAIHRLRRSGSPGLMRQRRTFRQHPPGCIDFLVDFEREPVSEARRPSPSHPPQAGFEVFAIQRRAGPRHLHGLGERLAMIRRECAAPCRSCSIEAGRRCGCGSRRRRRRPPSPCRSVSSKRGLTRRPCPRTRAVSQRWKGHGFRALKPQGIFRSRAGLL